MKRKASEALEVETSGSSWNVNWKTQARRPFRRGFIPYGSTSVSESQAAKRRSALGVEVLEDPLGTELTPAPVEAFEELGALPHWALEALRDDGHYEPLPLEAQALPIVLAGQNMAAVANPDSGQAKVYLLAAAAHIEDQPPLSQEEPGPVVLVLVASSDRAAEVTSEAERVMRHSERSGKHPGGIRTINLSGGGSRQEKLDSLGTVGAHIIIGTPKRLHDLLLKEHFSSLRVTFLVLDGADRLATAANGTSEIRDIVSWVRPERQTAVFAGAWPKAVAAMVGPLCRAGGDPVRIKVK